jgi:hypothetical protein
MLWKKVTIACFKAIFKNLPEETGYPRMGPIFEAETSRIRNGNHYIVNQLWPATRHADSVRRGVAPNISGIRSPEQIHMFGYILFTICLPSCRAKLGFSQPSLTFGIHQQYEKTFSFFPFRPYPLHTLSFSFCFPPSLHIHIRLPNLITVNFLKCLLCFTSVVELFLSTPWHLPSLCSVLKIYKIHRTLVHYVINNNNKWAIKGCGLGRNWRSNKEYNAE